MSTLWREPLLHFLVIGFALFLYYEWSTDNAAAPPKRLHVSGGEVAQLAANFERTRLRPPTEEELSAMIEGYVREEIFYREALAMGLEQDDPLVRRRLRMKLEFMLEELLSLDPSDALLTEYLRRHPDRFRREAELSFQQVYLDPDLRPDIERDAAQLLVRLQQGAAPGHLGDPTFVPRVYRQVRQSDIARDFGDGFAVQAAELPVKVWSGPVYSPFGAHLVQVESRIQAREPALEEVYDEVLRDYLAEKRQHQKEQAYLKLREGYQVTVAPLTAASVKSPTGAVTGEAR
ncbi:peptidyl-prolyl cis-trans isomerase [Ferrimonas futtsuensis]|uniref:peptidylprolyl isomerase n=1 Tax=Ferrimonas futtsuensis TaxID=364764 RepID=UPI00146BE66C|nr:peptidylprolyl isomerase [Ferrimonas futtsuensis]